MNDYGDGEDLLDALRTLRRQGHTVAQVMTLMGERVHLPESFVAEQRVGADDQGDPYWTSAPGGQNVPAGSGAGTVPDDPMKVLAAIAAMIRDMAESKPFKLADVQAAVEAIYSPVQDNRAITGSSRAAMEQQAAIEADLEQEAARAHGQAPWFPAIDGAARPVRYTSNADRMVAAGNEAILRRKLQDMMNKQLALERLRMDASAPPVEPAMDRDVADQIARGDVAEV